MQKKNVELYHHGPCEGENVCIHHVKSVLWEMKNICNDMNSTRNFISSVKVTLLHVCLILKYGIYVC